MSSDVATGAVCPLMFDPFECGRSSAEIEGATLEEMRARYAAEQALSLERKRREEAEARLAEQGERLAEAEKRAREAEVGMQFAEDKAKLAERQVKSARERADALEQQLQGLEGSATSVQANVHEAANLRRMYEKQMESQREENHAKMAMLESELRQAREQAVQTALRGAKDQADQTLTMRELEVATLKAELQRMKELVQSVRETTESEERLRAKAAVEHAKEVMSPPQTYHAEASLLMLWFRLRFVVACDLPERMKARED